MHLKKLILTLMATCASMSLYAQRTFVVAAGVSIYQDSAMNLKKPEADAKIFATTMGTHTKNIIRMSNRKATRDNILAKLDTVCKTAKEDDRIMFFFSGHGNDGFMYTHEGGYLRYEDIKRLLNSSKSKNKFCFVDACHSGSVAQGYKNDGSSTASASDGIFYFMSSSGLESSWESSMYDNGFFTQALAQALRGLADYNHDKVVTVEEVFKYVYKDVVSKAKCRQHPQLICPKELISTTPVVEWNK